MVANASNTGHLHAAGYGSLTSSILGSSGNPFTPGTTYNFLDFDAGASGTAINVTGLVFNGCRFQSNSTGFANIVMQSGAGAIFNDCSFVPRTALHTAPPGGFVWPSRTAATYNTRDTVQIPFADGYQYGVVMQGGSLYCAMNRCDMWGFGNAAEVGTGRNQTNYFTVDQCWIHDSRYDGASPPSGTPIDHTDGPGELSGANPTMSYVTITGCTIAGQANGNAIAFQGPTAVYDHLTFTNNYLTGFGYNLDPGHAYIGCTNVTVTDNVFATDTPWFFGPVYPDATAQFQQPTNLWRRNTLLVIGGTSPEVGSNPQWVSGDNGKYVYPDNTLSSTDFVGGRSEGSTPSVPTTIRRAHHQRIHP